MLDNNILDNALGKNIITKYVYAHLDRIIVISSFLIGLAIIFLSYRYGLGQYGMGLSFIGGSFAFWTIKNKFELIYLKCLCKHSEESYRLLFLVNNAIFFLCLLLSLLCLYFTLYSRPIWYFILVSIAFVSLFVEIMIWKPRILTNCLTLIKVMVLSLSFRFGRFYLYPVIPGTDTQTHLSFVSHILSYGYIPGYELADKYASTPLWHILVSVSGLISDCTLSDMLFSSIVVPSVIITSLFIFLLVRKMFNDQIGLIAVLLANVADLLLVLGLTNINTGSLVLLFLLVCLYCLIKAINSRIFLSLFLLLSFSIVFTHQLTAMCAYLIFFIIFLSWHLYRCSDYYTSNDEKPMISVLFITYLSIILIFSWEMIVQIDQSTFFESMTIRLEKSLSNIISEYLSQPLSPPANAYQLHFDNYGVLSNILYNFGFTMLLLFALVGIYSCICYRKTLFIRFSYLMVAIGLFFIIYPGTFLGLNKLLIPHRFIPFLEIFLIPFAAYAVYQLYLLNSQRTSKILMSLGVLVLIFFMITTPFINRSDSLYCSDREYRTEYTFSEIEALSWGTNGNLLRIDPLLNVVTISTIENIHSDNVEIYPEPSLGDYEIQHGNILIRQYFTNLGSKILYTGSFGETKEMDFSGYTGQIIQKSRQVYTNGECQVFTSFY